MPDVRPPSDRDPVRAAAVMVLFGLAVLGDPSTASAQGPAAEESVKPRSAATRAPAGATSCIDCGTVWSIERRERPRWSSIVGTGGAQGAMPQLIRPRSTVRRSDDAQADGERAFGAEAFEQPAANRGAPGPRGRTDEAAARGSEGRSERGAAADADPDAAAPVRSAGPAPLPERERSRVLRDADGPAPRRGWQLTVRMDDGTMQTAYSDTQPTLRIGDRVRMGGAPGALGSRATPR